MSKVLAVIVGYKNSRLTIQAAKSLSQQSVPVKTVVWDNYSNEAERKIIREAVELRQSSPLIAFPEDTIVVQCPDNLMWSPAINKVVEMFLEHTNIDTEQ